MSVSEDFKIDVKNYIELDNQIKEFQDIIKKIKKDKEKLEGHILHYMTTNGLNDKDINLSDGKLRCFTSKTSSSVNKKHIENSLALFFKGDYDKAKQVTDFIFSKREITQKVKLKRTRKKKSLDI
jgi:hypothetical protein|tara:strand:- start:2496 stop:2870 length:375 start_codon:yes stop_codon:yes gene_type:complete